MKKLLSLVLCAALVFACLPAQTASFEDLLGLEPTPSPTPEVAQAALPDLAITLGSMPLWRGRDDSPEEFPGEGVQFYFPDDDEAQTLAGAKRFYNEMLELGYTAAAMSLHDVKCIVFEQGEARVLLVPIAASGKVSIILGGNVRYVQAVKGNANPESIPRPDFEALFEVSAQDFGSGDTAWGFSMDSQHFSFADLRDATSAMNRASIALGDVMGYQKVLALVGGEIWGDMYILDGAHILVAQNNNKVLIRIQQDKPFVVTDPFAPQPADPTAAPPAEPTPAPTTEPTPVPTTASADPTIVPGSQTLPSFGAYLGWTPTIKEYIYTDPNGTEYWCEGYYGYDDGIRRAYLALLKEPRFGLTAIVDDSYTQGTNGMVYESAFVYAGPIDVPPPGMPLESGEAYHVYAASSEADDVLFTLVYPKELMPADHGDRSPYYGKLIQPTPPPTQSTGQSGGNSGGSGSHIDCKFCNGTGVCRHCAGVGTMYTVTCSVCNGTGKCEYCDGLGWQ